MDQDLNGRGGARRGQEVRRDGVGALRVGKLPTLLLHWSVVAVWLFTAAVSLHQWHGQSAELLSAAGVPAGRWHDWLIGGGAAIDLLIGLWLWLRPSRLAYGVALAGMIAMTLAATVLLPDLWLHPLGPLSKNLPIAAALILLMQSMEEKESSR